MLRRFNRFLLNPLQSSLQSQSYLKRLPNTSRCTYPGVNGNADPFNMSNYDHITFNGNDNAGTTALTHLLTGAKDMQQEVHIVISETKDLQDRHGASLALLERYPEDVQLILYVLQNVFGAASDKSGCLELCHRLESLTQVFFSGKF